MTKRKMQMQKHSNKKLKRIRLTAIKIWIIKQLKMMKENVKKEMNRKMEREEKDKRL